MTENRWKAEIVSWLKVLTVSVIIGFLSNFIFSGFDLFSYSWRAVKFVIVVSLLLGVALGKGNQYIERFVLSRHPWKANPSQTFRRILILSNINNTIVIFLLNILIFSYFAKDKFYFAEEFSKIIEKTIVVSFFGFLIWGVYFLFKFFEEYKQSLINEEKYKRDIVVHHYEMLKNQVNPHFLFNSLNVLTSLVETNSEAAVTFIRKLAEVYHYVLNAKDKEIVPLSEELRLTEAYIFMQKNRFGNNLIVTINVDPEGKKIVPLALQMLVENALKHNVVSSEKPLTIAIYELEGYLICENNLQEKSTLPDSNTIGLKNINERYEFLTKAPMTFGEEEGKFVVKLPLIRGEIQATAPSKGNPHMLSV